MVVQNKMSPAFVLLGVVNPALRRSLGSGLQPDSGVNLPPRET